MQLPRNNFYIQLFLMEEIQWSALPVFQAEEYPGKYPVVSGGYEPTLFYTKSGRVILEPFDMMTEENFNKLAMQSLRLAHSVSKQYARNEHDAGTVLERNDMPFGSLVPDPDHLNDVYVVSDPEFLGIVAIRDDGFKLIGKHGVWNYLYAIAVTNPKAIVKVDPLFFDQPHQ